MGFFGKVSRIIRGAQDEPDTGDNQSRVLRYIQDYLALNGVIPSVAHLRDELGIPIPELRTNLEDIVRQWTLKAAFTPTLAAPAPATAAAAEPTSIADLDMDSVLSQILMPSARPGEASGIVPDSVGIELSAEVFFNARHSLRSEWEGEAHAHTWKLLVVATGGQLLQSGALTAEKLREAVQSAVVQYEGADLNRIESMAGLAPTLERMAVHVDRDVRAQLADLGGVVVSVTLWDKPTTSVRLMRSPQETATIDAIESLG